MVPTTSLYGMSWLLISVSRISSACLFVGVGGCCYILLNRRARAVGLLWTRDRRFAETSTCTTHRKHKRITFVTPVDFFSPKVLLLFSLCSVFRTCLFVSNFLVCCFVFTHNTNIHAPPWFSLSLSLSTLSVFLRSDCPGIAFCPLLYNAHNTNINAPGGIRTRNPRKRSAAGLRFRPRGHRNQQRIVFRLELKVEASLPDSSTLQVAACSQECAGAGILSIGKSLNHVTQGSNPSA